MFQKRFRTIIGALAISLLLAGCGSAANGGSTAKSGTPTKLTVAYAEKTISAAEETYSYSVPKALGLFKEKNLDVDMTMNDGSTAAIQSVASGSSDIGFASAASIATAVGKGVPIKAIAGATTFWPYQLATKPGSAITSIADLKGKKIGVISLASASYSDLISELKSGNLTVKDVQIVAVGADTSAAEALNSGQVDAIDTYRDAYTSLESQGQHFQYLPVPDTTKDLFSLTYFTSTKTLQEKRQALIDFVQCSYKGLIWAYTKPDDSLKLLFADFPQLPGSSDINSADAKQTKVQMQAAIDGWVPQNGEKDASKWGNWESLSDKRWEKLVQWAKDTDQTDKLLTVDQVWDGSLMKDIYDFDAAQVLQLKPNTDK